MSFLPRVAQGKCQELLGNSVFKDAICSPGQQIDMQEDVEGVGFYQKGEKT